MKEYLGDGVYVEQRDGMLKLVTSDGITETNVIYLEPEVAGQLAQYIERWFKRYDAA